MTSCIFIFTRDLRLEDNIGLNYCAEKYDIIIPLFIITETQVSENNDYRSLNAISFMKKSLEKLFEKTNKKLNIFYIKKNNYENVLNNLIYEQKISSIIINKDYSPFSVKREDIIKEICKKNKILFESHHDHLLTQDFIYNSSGEYYKKFTPFYDKVIKTNIKQPTTHKDILKKLKSIKKDNIKTLGKLKTIDIKIPYEIDYEKLKDVIVKNTDKSFISNYDAIKYELEQERSRLSVYLKFGIISTRQVYNLTKKYKKFTRSLFWRDFYYTYYYHNPKALEDGDGWANIKNWPADKKNLEKWKQGKTGFPIIDASMNQLNKEGFMPNRSRMLVASFLTKLLLIDWKDGEKYFSQQLLDIDWVINNANWQNEVSVAKHSQPYFRVKNPWIQTKKYDPECLYIKKWIPELKEIEAKDILNWDKTYKKYKDKYIQPIINYDDQKKKYISYVKKRT